MIDHQAGSFLVDRLRLLGALVMPFHWRRVLLITLFIIMRGWVRLCWAAGRKPFSPEQSRRKPIRSRRAPHRKPNPTACRALLPKTPKKQMMRKAAGADCNTGGKAALYRTQARRRARAVARRHGRRGGGPVWTPRRIALALGTGRPYQALLHDVDPDWLAPEDMGLLRRYGQEGFYDANHLARRLSALLEGDSR